MRRQGRLMPVNARTGRIDGTSGQIRSVFLDVPIDMSAECCEGA